MNASQSRVFAASPFASPKAINSLVLNEQSPLCVSGLHCVIASIFIFLFWYLLQHHSHRIPLTPWLHIRISLSDVQLTRSSTRLLVYSNFCPDRWLYKKPQAGLRIYNGSLLNYAAPILCLPCLGSFSQQVRGSSIDPLTMELMSSSNADSNLVYIDALPSQTLSVYR